ncbi:hypothetical protein ACVDG5_005615 [Mesorhizobium sp. ORM6]
MAKTVNTVNNGLGAVAPAWDQPFLDTTAYGSGPDDFVSDATENAAITHHVATVNGISIPYTATAGHLVAVDPSSSKPAAKFFYVAFTADSMDANTRPVTFSTMAGLARLRSSCYSARSRPGASRPICRALRRLRPTPWRTIPIA